MVTTELWRAEFQRRKIFVMPKDDFGHEKSCLRSRMAPHQSELFQNTAALHPQLTQVPISPSYRNVDRTSKLPLNGKI
jgi:hypothetical protein